MLTLSPSPECLSTGILLFGSCLSKHHNKNCCPGLVYRHQEEDQEVSEISKYLLRTTSLQAFFFFFFWHILDVWMLRVTGVEFPLSCMDQGIYDEHIKF